MRVGHYEELPLVVNIGRFGRAVVAAVTSTSAPPVVPTNPTCDCSGRPNSTPGELTIVVLSAVFQSVIADEFHGFFLSLHSSTGGSHHVRLHASIVNDR